ncbi:DUF4169 family protein [Rhodobacteraceae bacterium CCMM004]|nr:DUF4169 family protein [Rhodobacteraceae bacterium CCMM004]
MSKPVNLNRVRKDRAREAARRRADANAAKHGRTKAERAADAAGKAAEDARHEGHRREE